MATISPFNQSTNSESLPYQLCLISSIPEHVQHTVRDVTNIVVRPLDMLLALLSVTCNCVVLTAIVRTRSIQHPSLLLLGNLSITDVLWAIFSIIKNIVTFTLEGFCPKELTNIERAFLVFCFTSSFGLLSIISRDRFVAVRKPWWYRNRVTRSGVIKQTSVICVWSFIISVLVLVENYSSSLDFVSQIIAGSTYAVFIIAIIGSYVGIFVANVRHRNTMNQHGVQVLATLKREKRLANTVGLILIVLCFTFIPALITPLVLVVVGFKGNAVLPFRPFYRFLVTLNGLLNPLLNYGRNADVRRAVRGLIRCPQRVTQVHPGRIGDNGVNRNN